MGSSRQDPMYSRNTKDKILEADRGKHKCFSCSSFYGYLWMQVIVLGKKKKIHSENRIAIAILNTVEDTEILH